VNALLRLLRSASLRSILGTSAVLLAARAGGTLLGFVLQAFLARALGAGGLGAYYMLVSLSGVCAVIGAIGYPVLAGRFVARYRMREASGLLPLFLRTGFVDTAIVAVGLGAAIALAGIALAEDAQLRWAVIFAAVSIPPLAAARFATAVANARRRFYIAFLPDLIVRPAFLLLVVGAAVWLRGTVGVVAVLACYALIAWAVLIAQLCRFERSPMLPASPSRKLSRVAPVWRKLAAVLMITPLVTTMLGDIALILLWPLLDAGDVGVFGAALKMAMLFGFFVQVIHQTMLPDLAEAAERRRLDAALATTILINRIAFGVVLASAAFVAMFGQRLLGVFGEEFEAATWPLVVLVLGLAPRAAAGPASQLLVVFGREWLSVAAGVGAVVYLGLANAVLVPSLGLMGAAVAFSSMAAVSAVLLGWFLRRYEGVRVDVFVRAPAAPVGIGTARA
jgi:O-antigen/teichoic acid export membrane protein